MIAPSKTDPNTRLPLLSVKIALCFLGLLMLSGCGRAAYEGRLQQTVALAKYREKLDDNLSYEWSQKGVKIRVPRQFKEIKDDRKEEDEDTENSDEPPAPDPRQPKFMSTPLPGIIGAWQAEVDLIEPDGKSQAYIYVLSNYDMWTEEGQAEEALKFNDSLAPIAVVDGMRAKLPEPEEWISESHPRTGGYLPTDRLTAALLKSRIALPFTPTASSSGNGGDDSNGGDDRPAPAAQTIEMDVNCKIYLVEKKDMKVTLVFIVPANVADAENLSLDTAKQRSSRFAMSLDTLSVSSNKPKRAKKKEGGNDASSGLGGF